MAGAPEWRRHIRPVAARSLPPVVLLCALGFVWQAIAMRNRYLLPSLGAIWGQLASHPSWYIDDAATTLREVAAGLGASFVIAFSLAIAMSHSKVIERAVMPLAVVVNVTPVVALAPGLATALKFGYAPRYVITGLIVFFPLLINSLAGLRSVDRDILRYFYTLDAPRRYVLVHLRIPSSLPFLFAAARICAPLSLIGAVVAEFSAASNVNTGLGTLVFQADQLGNVAQAYSGIVCLSLLGLLLTVLVAVVEARLLHWHTWSSARTGVT